MVHFQKWEFSAFVTVAIRLVRFALYIISVVDSNLTPPSTILISSALKDSNSSDKIDSKPLGHDAKYCNFNLFPNGSELDLSCLVCYF